MSGKVLTASIDVLVVMEPMLSSSSAESAADPELSSESPQDIAARFVVCEFCSI